MKSWIQRNLPGIAWLLTALSVVLAITAWYESLGWQLRNITAYQLFPVFGLVAFSTMWVQYLVSAEQQLADVASPSLERYYQVSGFVVLVAIVAHPGILGWQLWRDGLGLPPGSELAFVGPALHAAVIIGMTALLIFLAFELRRFFATKPWWRFMEYLVDIAVVAVYYHSLRLGHQTRGDWFAFVWYFYGVSLILFLTYKYLLKVRSRTIR